MALTLSLEKLRKFKRFLHQRLNLKRRLNREPHLLFHSPKAALSKLTHKQIENNHAQFQSLISTLSSDLSDVISVHEDVISYPIKETGNDWYEGWLEGGLINSKTHKLIEEAIYFEYGYPFQLPPSSFDAEVVSKDVPEIEDTVFFGGILFNHFGHFLLDSLARLWAYPFFKELDPFICFYTPWGVSNFLEKSNYVNQVLTGFDIPHRRLVFINDLIKLKRVIIPHQKYGLEHADNPEPVFLDFVKNFRFNADIPKGFESADRIYVSRSKMPFNSGRVIGEDLFEKYLMSNGYKIFYPEHYTLIQQLTVYSNAKKMIFLSGSSLHSCILLPDLRADVAVIARWQDPDDNLYQIKQFTGFGKSVLGVDALRGQYQFGRSYVNALSDIDWYKASILLKSEGFVDTPFNDFNQLDYSSILKSEIKNFVSSISNDPEFIDFMINLKEK